MERDAKTALAAKGVCSVAAVVLSLSIAFANDQRSADTQDRHDDAAASDVLTTDSIPSSAGIEQRATPVAIAAVSSTLVDPDILTPRNPIGQLGLFPIHRHWLGNDQAIVGIASFYDDPQQTASGEQYDPNVFAAAAQLEIRGRFGGIRFGKNYQPAYGLAEYEGKKVILKFNDVGPLKPGRKFDLTRAAMAFFGGLDKGLLPGFKVTPLPLGATYAAGPVTDEQLAGLGIMTGDHPVHAFAFDDRPLASVHADLHPTKAGAEFLWVEAGASSDSEADETSQFTLEPRTEAVAVAGLHVEPDASPMWIVAR